VYGDDLEELARIGAQVEEITAAVPGAQDVAAEQATGLPVLSIEPRRDALARYGLDVHAVQELVAAAYGGREAGTVFDGDRRHDLVVRFPEKVRGDVDGIGRIPIPMSGGRYVTLGEVANLELARGVNQVNRENGKRRVV